ncbi:MAG: alkaline phosphatase family protein [Candidatus Brocadiales bacterium]|nr:alkaline phosphatase family protein [Candidatus Brocadiales bacterium]
MKRYFYLFGLLWLGGSLFSCASVSEKSSLGPGALEIPGNNPWTKTNITVEPGQYLHIVAQGKVEITNWSYFGRDYDYTVGPEGTYNFSEKVKEAPFPLAAAEAGPAPCYALIGKIREDGEPFLVGQDSVINVEKGGELFLGINDFDVKDNTGKFYSKVDIYKQEPTDLMPRDTRKIEDVKEAEVSPVDDARVLIIYLDGINYEALKEMAYKGYLPNIKKYFVDGGTEIANAFTVFPSTTFTSTAAFLTASFTDRTGIKSDAFLDRRAMRMKHFFHPYGPAGAARRMKPGVIGDMVDPTARAEALDSIYDYVTKSEMRFSTTVLPVLFDHPPTFYNELLANNIRYLGAHQVRHKFDRINAKFAIEEVIKKDNRVMYVWLPGVDERSHESPRGQWGGARKPLYNIDRHIGDMIKKLEKEGILEKTYMVLYSDHGHVGGKEFINQSFDITHDFFYKSIRDMDGDRIPDSDSGLGFNIRFVEHDQAFHREHLDKDEGDFMAVGNMGYGVAVAYLPYKSKYSRNWTRPNSYYDLTHYEIYPGMQPVNILDRLLKVDYSDSNLFPYIVSPRPIDMVMVRVAKDTTLIINSQGLQALIERRPTGTGKRDFEYRYHVVTNFEQDQEGKNSFQEVENPTEDPLGYLSSPDFVKYTKDAPEWLKNFHPGNEWLEATKNTRYPDSVVALAHFTAWDDSIKELEDRYGPDFGVVPKKGWSFQTDARLASDHGYPFYESMHIPLFITGPNIKKGTIVTNAHRLIDIVPTVLDMVGAEYNKDALDGKSITGIYEGGEEGEVEVGHEEIVGFYTDRGIPIEMKAPPEELGFNLHDIDNPYDIHFIAADIATLFDQQAFRITDDILDLFIPGASVRPFRTAIDKGTDLFHSMPDNIFEKRFAQLMAALRIKQFDVVDGVSMIAFGNFFTESNFLRANLVIDWTQDIMGDFNKLLGAPLFKFEKGLIPGKYFHRYAIDYPQYLLDRLRKSIIEVVYRVFYRGIFHMEDGISATGNAFKTKTWQTAEIEGSFGQGEGLEILHPKPEKK